MNGRAASPGTRVKGGHSYLRTLGPQGLLILAVLAIYGRTLGHDFVSWDDFKNVTANPYLDHLSWDNVARFWKEPYFTRYAPVGYMLLSTEAWIAQRPRDGSGQTLFRPGVFHAVSLLLHMACTLLAYRLLAIWTAAPAPACLGALLFALHPLQVESVSWVSDQFGLFSAMFSFLAINFYVSCRAGTPRGGPAGAGPVLWRGAACYALATLAFLCALLTKPSAVCLPLVAAVVDQFLVRRAWKASALLLSPWLALALAIVWITRQHQPENAALWAPQVWLRPLIAGDALAFYLFKLVWPVNLGILYERAPKFVLAQGWSWITWLLPVAVFALVIWRERRTGLAIVGWFVAALLPVLGFIPFGYQGFSTVADRYMYLAMFAPALALAQAVSRGGSWRPVAAGVLVTAFGLLSFFQCGHWRNSFTLYEQALRVHPNSDVAHSELGKDLFLAGQAEAAERHLLRAHELNKQHAGYVFSLAMLLEQRGDLESAEQLYRGALEMNPRLEYARVNLGTLLMKRNDFAGALREFDEALRAEPTSRLAGFNRGLALERLGRMAEATDQFRAVLARWPDHHPSRLKLGMQLAAQGQRREAIDEFRYILSRQDDPGAHAELAAALLESGDAQAAKEHYRRALAQPSQWWPAIAGRAAWLLATHAASEIRDGPQAVLLAEEACRRTGHRSPELLRSLAAAKAETGDFAGAIATAEQARDLATESAQAPLAAELEEHLRSYRQMRPLRTPAARS